MTTDAARKAVLDTSELLEQIILCLPMTNIFVIQRVCQKFKAVIATSPNIQTKLFLRLRADVPEEAWALDTHSGPLPRHPDNVRFRKVDVNSKGTLYKPVVLNPLLQRRPLFSRTSSAADRLFRSDSLGETVEMMFPQSHFGSQPSFLKTYITDPPCHTAKAAIAAAYLIDPKDDPEEDSVYGVISGEEISSDQGLTIGDVIRARGDVRMHWDAIGLGDSEDSDAQLRRSFKTRVRWSRKAARVRFFGFNCQVWSSQQSGSGVRYLSKARRRPLHRRGVSSGTHCCV